MFAKAPAAIPGRDTEKNSSQTLEIRLVLGALVKLETRDVVSDMTQNQ